MSIEKMYRRENVLALQGLSHGVRFSPMSGTDLSTTQAADRLHVKRQTVGLWCRRGLLPNAYQMDTPRGSVWMIPEGDLRDFKPPKPTGRPPKGKPETGRKKAVRAKK
jgi:hypothetical protein